MSLSLIWSAYRRVFVATECLQTCPPKLESATAACVAGVSRVTILSVTTSSST